MLVFNFTKEQIEEAGKYCEIEAYQPQYSMLDGDNEAVIRWAAAPRYRNYELRDPWRRYFDRNIQGSANIWRDGQ